MGPAAAHLTLPTQDLTDLFLFEEKRKVQQDRTVSLHGVVFEVDAALVGETVTLRYMAALTREECTGYLAHRLRLATAETPLFDPGAEEALYQATGGVPRKINLLAHHTLMAAALARAKLATADHVRPRFPKWPDPSASPSRRIGLRWQAPERLDGLAQDPRSTNTPPRSSTSDCVPGPVGARSRQVRSRPRGRAGGGGGATRTCAWRSMSPVSTRQRFLTLVSMRCFGPSSTPRGSARLGVRSRTRRTCVPGHCPNSVRFFRGGPPMMRAQAMKAAPQRERERDAA